MAYTKPSTFTAAEETSASVQTAMSPTDEVFNISELLEAVLVYVAPFDLLVNVQRTCKTFRNAVKGSTTLQKKLFLMPDDTHDIAELSLLPFRVRDLEFKSCHTNGAGEEIDVVIKVDIADFQQMQHGIRSSPSLQDVVISQPTFERTSWRIFFLGCSLLGSCVQGYIEGGATAGKLLELVRKTLRKFEVEFPNRDRPEHGIRIYLWNAAEEAPLNH